MRLQGVHVSNRFLGCHGTHEFVTRPVESMKTMESMAGFHCSLGVQWNPWSSMDYMDPMESMNSWMKSMISYCDPIADARASSHLRR